MFPFLKTKKETRREELMKELTYIELYTKRAANHALLGDYRSSLRGTGLEFVEHRKYSAGDDYRRIDWSALARTREAFLKICHEEKQMTAMFVADLSRSMELGSKKFSKMEVLIEAVATLCFSAASENMSVGLVAGGQKIDLYRKPRKGRRQVWSILGDLLDYNPSSGGTDLELLLKYGLQQLKGPGLFFVLSDFIVMESILQQPLISQIADRHDLVPIIIEDELENELPEFKGYVRLRDLESGNRTLLSLSSKNCQTFVNGMKNQRETLHKTFFRLGAIPVILNTGQSPLLPLMEFFLERKRSR